MVKNTVWLPSPTVSIRSTQCIQSGSVPSRLIRMPSNRYRSCSVTKARANPSLVYHNSAGATSAFSR